MCYDVAYLTKKREQYKQRYQQKEGFSDLEKKVPKIYHSNGFEHAELPVITNAEPEKVQLYTWGLIPFWVKDPQQATKISNSTLNARGEEIYNKPAFRNSVNKRCLVIVDGFFEHHWKGDKSFPFFIKMKDDRPFSLAGLWSKWQFEDIVRYTFTIITTEANPLLAEIHNKPKASEGSRMPVILSEDDEHLWLEDVEKDVVQSLIKPFDQTLLEAYTVGRLRGKAYPGNVPEVIEPVKYSELSQQDLF